MHNGQETPDPCSKPGITRRFTHWWCRPIRLALGLVLVICTMAAIVLSAGFHTTMHAVSTDAFCISCHEMESTVYQEFIQTSHYTNRTGIQATCSDCHTPKAFLPMMARKIQSVKELYGHLTGIINTPEKFEAHRLQMAQTEWHRMQSTDSQTCRNCHKFEQMDLAQQKPLAARMHSTASENGKTCIDCHKGFAHNMPALDSIEFLADRHGALNLDCAQCHIENPPEQDVSTAKCFSCHGNYEYLGRLTSHMGDHNPHLSHLGDVDCSDCHKGHIPSVLACNDCHTYDMKVP